MGKIKRSRGSGVLMHISSLNGRYSAGSFGREAMEFVDYLAKGNFTYWQVLPFCMPDECNSPYKSHSAFAGNPLFIDLPTLFEEGLLTEEELGSAEQKSPYLCEFDRLSAERLSLLEKAFGRAKENRTLTTNIAKFIKTHGETEKACEFMALREQNGGKMWTEWEETTASPERKAFWEFLQYEFYVQWKKVREYANGKGIKIIGDIPIYVDYDSSDVLMNREMFLLDKDNRPLKVAGVPPDYFSEEGQMWGNPLYNWEAMAADNFGWWKKRMKWMFELFDGVRIDHFRAFASYWAVPAGAKTAKEGKWEKGPGKPFVNMLNKIKGENLIIAEDLGDITEDVTELLEYSGLPGMRVFQFGFLGDTDSPHLPHNYPANTVAYTGTHDNNTLLGFIWESSGETRDKIFDYCGIREPDWRKAEGEIVKSMMASHAGTLILPIQDLLAYGADTRMNTPGRASGNWAYRVTPEQLNEIDWNKYAEINNMYGRTASKNSELSGGTQ